MTETGWMWKSGRLETTSDWTGLDSSFPDFHIILPWVRSLIFLNSTLNPSYVRGRPGGRPSRTNPISYPRITSRRPEGYGRQARMDADPIPNP